MRRAKNDLALMLKTQTSSDKYSDYSKDTNKHPIPQETIKSCNCMVQESQSFKSLDIKFHRKKDSVQYDSPPSTHQENLSIHAELPQLHRDLNKIAQPTLTSEDLQWLGKNYSKQSGQIVAESSNLKYCPERQFSTYPTTTVSYQNHKEEIYQAANSLITRVQSHEEKLLKQLAEMSFSDINESVSEFINHPAMGNKFHNEMEPSSTTAVLNIRKQSSSPSNQPPSTLDNHKVISLDEEQSRLLDRSFSLVDDEWLENLIRAELEIL